MPLSQRIGALLFVAAFAPSCASGPAMVQPPHHAEMAARIARPSPPGGTHQAPGDTPPHHTGAITLAEAAALVLEYNPGLAASAWRAGAVEAEGMQAGLAPNPDIGFEAGEFGGQDSRRGLESAELSVSLSQVIELGGKRGKRIDAAALDYDMARWDYEITRITTLTETLDAFIGAVAARDRLALADESVRLAGRFNDAAHEMVIAGKAAPLEQTRARVALARAAAAQADAVRACEAARGRLALLWGGAPDDITTVTGTLDAIPAPPAFADLRTALDTTPELQRWTVELDRRAAAITLEKSRRVPDVTVTAGAARFRGDRENAAIAGISIPLPFFDRNRGGVLGAERLLAAAREERRAGESALRLALAEGYAALVTSRARADAFLTDIVPGAQSALAAAEEGYRAGKYAYLDVIDARRAYVEVRGESIDALAACHTARAELERLVGVPLDAISRTATKDSAQ